MDFLIIVMFICFGYLIVLTNKHTKIKNKEKHNIYNPAKFVLNKLNEMESDLNGK